MIKRLNTNLAPKESLDDVTLNYAATANITNIKELQAFNRLYNRMKGCGLWQKARRVYPVSPTSISAALVCAKTLTSGTAVNSPTHDSTGITTNGTSSYVNTNFNMSVSDGLESVVSVSASISIVDNTRTSVGAFFGSGQSITVVGTPENDIRIYFTSTSSLIMHGVMFSSTSTYMAEHDITLSGSPGTVGIWSVTRTNTTELALYRDTTQVATNTAEYPYGYTHPPGRMFIGARSDSSLIPTSRDYTAITYNFFYVGGGLNETDVINLNNIINAYRSEL